MLRLWADLQGWPQRRTVHASPLVSTDQLDSRRDLQRADRVSGVQGRQESSREARPLRIAGDAGQPHGCGRRRMGCRPDVQAGPGRESDGLPPLELRWAVAAALDEGDGAT